MSRFLALWSLFLFSAHSAPLNATGSSDLLQSINRSISSKNNVDSNTFHPDCADPHNKEVSCTVHKVSCSEVLFPPVPTGEEPPEPHDLRIESFAKSMARQHGRHQLHVDISWQMPPKNASASLRAFKLEILNRHGQPPVCFAFNVTHFELNEHASSPRFHFTSDSLFEFEEEYAVTLFSYPQSSKKPKVSRTTTMPVDPDNVLDGDNITQYCKTHSHIEASRWTAGFRKIFLQSQLRTILIEFGAAPPHLCFEEYEVRLLDETGIELLHHVIINASELKEEIIEGKRVYYGEHNFTGLELETDYIPSVIPVDIAASDGRCLCPTNEQHGACSCIAADWKKVRLHRMEKPHLPAPVPPAVDRSNDEGKMFSILKVILMLFAMVLSMCCLVFGAMVFCRKYRQRGKAVRIRFISDNVHNGNGAMLAAEPRSPLIFNSPESMSILILYAHDCPLHEGAVDAFAQLLRDTFGFDVHIDSWDTDDIEKNLAEYINGSVVRADKIIVVNSVGAFHRVRARHMKEDPIERINGSPLDGLFGQQIELALQHARVISLRFSYTPATFTLFSLTPLLQYTVPDNLGLLIASLSECSTKNDPRLSGYSPELARFNAAVSRMSNFVTSEPKWFEKFHRRVVSIPVPQSVPSRSIDSGIETASQEVNGFAASSSFPLALAPSSLIPPRPSSLSPIPSSSNAVVENSPLGNEDEPLLEQESPEESPVMIAKPKDDNMEEEVMDSAFHSGQMTQQQDIPEVQIADKPRLDEVVADAQPKDARYADSNGDSGMVDMDSAALIST